MSEHGFGTPPQNAPQGPVAGYGGPGWAGPGWAGGPGYGGPGYGYGYGAWDPSITQTVTRAALTGASVGAMVGAARGARATEEPQERAGHVARAALQDATRLGVATGLGAAVASMVPAGPFVRGLSMIAAGAVVLAAQEGHGPLGRFGGEDG